MRLITKYSPHTYKTKQSALRAACNAVGEKYLVDEMELQNRFDGLITVTADMVNVVAVAGGWQWTYTYDLSDVVVEIFVGDGVKCGVAYAEVAHWKDARTPVSDVVMLAGTSVEAYLRALDVMESIEALHDAYDRALALCVAAGVDFGGMVNACREVECALMSDNPAYIAVVIRRAEPFGLASAKLRERFLLMAVRRGVRPVVYEGMAKASLANKVA